MTGFTPNGLPYPTDGDSLKSAVQATPQALAEAIDAMVQSLTAVPAPASYAPSAYGATVADSVVAEPTRAYLYGRHVDLAVFVKTTAALAAGGLILQLPATVRPARTWRGALTRSDGVRVDTELTLDGYLYLGSALAANQSVYGTISWTR